MIDNPFTQREIWFLTGSQDLYGEDTLAQVSEQSQEVVRTLQDSGTLPLRIVWKPICKDRDAIREVALEANSAAACVGVIVWMHTFSPAKMWILGLKELNKPMLHFHTQASESLPWATIDMDYMNLNQSAHGDREFGYIATRMGLSRKTVVGHASNKAAQEKIATWMRAATGWAEMHHTRLARFGDNMRDVAVTEGDKTEAEIKLGVSVNTWGVNDLVEAVEAVSDSAVDQLVAEYDATYNVAPELGPAGDRRESLRYAARQELGLRSFLEAGNFTAFTTNFQDLGGLRQLPGLAVQRLMAAGYGFGAEGDWKTAILVRAAKVMGYGLPGGASLMEDYCYEMTPGKQKILGAHMLEVCPTLTTDKPSLEIHPLGIGDREDPVRLVFTADTGVGIVASLADMRNRFRITANEVDLVSPDEPLPQLPVARAVWEPKPDFETSVECWLNAGGAHHTVMSTQIGLDVMEDFTQMAEIELATITAATTTAQFKRELCWNQAYYHLAEGL